MLQFKNGKRVKTTKSSTYSEEIGIMGHKHAVWKKTLLTLEKYVCLNFWEAAKLKTTAK